MNTQQCSRCLNGYYADNKGVCQQCNSNCTECKDQKVCTGCKAGWTLNRNHKGGSCRVCESPCATCSGNPKYCTTCIAGHVRISWKCKPTNSTRWRIIVSEGEQTVLNGIDTIVCAVIAMSKGSDPKTAGNTCDASEATVETVNASSTRVEGITTSGNTATLAVGLSSGGITGFTITSSSVEGASS